MLCHLQYIILRWWQNLGRRKNAVRRNTLRSTLKRKSLFRHRIILLKRWKVRCPFLAVTSRHLCGVVQLRATCYTCCVHFCGTWKQTRACSQGRSGTLQHKHGRKVDVSWCKTVSRHCPHQYFGKDLHVGMVPLIVSVLEFPDWMFRFSLVGIGWFLCVHVDYSATGFKEKFEPVHNMHNTIWCLGWFWLCQQQKVFFGWHCGTCILFAWFHHCAASKGWIQTALEASLRWSGGR